MGRPRILLADDHTLFLEALKRLLEPEFEVVGTVTDGRAALSQARLLNPDVVILDISMPLLNGLDAARLCQEMSPAPKVILLTMNADPEIAQAALELGASGYLLKTSTASELGEAIRDVLGGLTFVTSSVRRNLKELVAQPGGVTKQRGLNPRQREVLQLLAEGRLMKEVADILHVTPRTVAYHKYKIMADLGLKNSAELVQYAVRTKLIG